MKANYEIRVGMFTFFAFILLLWGWFWLKSFSLFHTPQKFIVSFHDVEGLHNAAPVNINGVRVGDVEKIELKGRGKVLVYLRITAEKTTIPQGASITIQTLGMVGAKYVEITLPEEGPIPHADILPDTIVTGQDPVRVELIFNQMATELGGLTNLIGSKESKAHLADTLKNSSAAIKNINSLTSRLDKNTASLDETIKSVNIAVKKYTNLANDIHNTSQNASNFFAHGTKTFDSINVLSSKLEVSSNKFNKLLDNSGLISDLKTSLELAKQTIYKIDTTANTINKTLDDKNLRQDLITMLTKLNNSTKQINNSMSLINGLAKDKNLRSDTKNILKQANQTIINANNLLNNADFNGNLKKTMLDVQKAAGDIDITSKQLNSVLSKRSPLLHLMFGRSTSKTENKNDNKTTTKVNTGVCP